MVTRYNNLFNESHWIVCLPPVPSHFSIMKLNTIHSSSNFLLPYKHFHTTFYDEKHKSPARYKCDRSVIYCGSPNSARVYDTNKNTYGEEFGVNYEFRERVIFPFRLLLMEHLPQFSWTRGVLILFLGRTSPDSVI